MYNTPDKTIRLWFMLCAILVFGMTWIGGYTRLTKAGLSITEWKPITGIIPPKNDYEWQKEFDNYKKTQEFRTYNSFMNLGDFRRIFFTEYLHRIAARITALVILIPFLYFLIKGRLNGSSLFRATFCAILVLLQGFVGWYMVSSGLADEPSVSHFRLAFHMSCAALLFYTLIKGFSDLLFDGTKPKGFPEVRVFIAICFIQFFFGALTAGTNGAKLYGTFPKFGDEFIPSEFYSFKHGIASLVSEPTIVQFIHRLIGSILLVSAILCNRPKNFSLVSLLLLIFMVIQIALGAETVLTFGSILIASLHQLNGMIVLGIATFLSSKNTN